MKYMQRKEYILQGSTVPSGTGEGTVPHGEKSSSTALPALEPNLTGNWTMIVVSIHEQDMITNRCGICSL